MRTPPSLRELPRYPVVGAVAALAVATSVAWWSQVDVSPLVADYRVWPGQPWRLVTSALPHIDPLHLAFNVYWLWVFGTLVEDELGPLRTGAILLLFAVGSAAAEFAFMAGGVGLSGVGYGLFGFLWLLGKSDGRFSDAVDGRTTQLFVGWFFLCIVLTASGYAPVANIAHGVGALLGVMLGLVVASRAARRRALAAALAATMAVLLVLATVARPYVNVSALANQEIAYAGYQHLMAGENTTAARLYRQAVIMNGGAPVYWQNYGIALERLGRLDEAAKAYGKAQELERDSGAPPGQEPSTQ